MPTLREVLEFMCQPAVKDTWLLLDIKVDNNAEDIIRLTGETLRAAGGGVEFWGNRVVLGCWTLNFIPVRIFTLFAGFVGGRMGADRVSCVRGIYRDFQ